MQTTGWGRVGIVIPLIRAHRNWKYLRTCTPLRMGFHSMEMRLFAPVIYGIQRLTRGRLISRHRHNEPYAAVVLDGGYEEAGDWGRFHARPGDVLFHDRFEAHANWISGRGALILNLPLPTQWHSSASMGHIYDPDRLVRAAEREGLRLASALLKDTPASVATAYDWPDILAAALVANPSLRLDAWSDKRGLASATVSRGFKKVYDVSPSRFRLEVRTSYAWRQLERGQRPLAEVALLSGFADQAHMTRAIHMITGRPPGAWRERRQMRSRLDATAMS